MYIRLASLPATDRWSLVGCVLGVNADCNPCPDWQQLRLKPAILLDLPRKG